MQDQDIIDQALIILESRLKKPEQVFTGSKDVKSYLKLQFEGLKYESFRVMFLNTQHGLLGLKELFRGTVNASPVYPREVVRAALDFNASAVILVHNHPSGLAEPSVADQHLTSELKKALSVVDVNVLDHIIVGHGEPFSFVENHLLIPSL